MEGPTNSIEELQFYLNKLLDTESTIKRILKSPQFYHKDDFEGVLAGFAEAIELVEKKFVAAPKAAEKKHVKEMLIGKFQNIKKRFVQYFTIDPSQIKFSEDIVTVPLKEDKKLAPELIECEGAEQEYQEYATKAKIENAQIEAALADIKEITNQLASEINSQDNGLTQIAENVTATKKNLSSGNAAVAQAASGKGSYIGWRIKWAGLLGILGAGIGTVIVPIIGTGIGAAAGAGLGVKIGGDIAKKVERLEGNHSESATVAKPEQEDNKKMKKTKKG